MFSVTYRRTLHVATLLTAACLAAACGSSEPDTNDSAPTSTTSVGRPALPEPVGDLPTFIAAQSGDSGACTDDLVSGLTAIVTNINYYSEDLAGDGTATITEQTSSQIEGTPVCTFTIEPGNTDLP
jgi:hypothetical protein